MNGDFISDRNYILFTDLPTVLEATELSTAVSVTTVAVVVFVVLCKG